MIPKPGPSASRGEKRLYKVLASSGLSNAAYAARCEQVAEKFPDQRIAAATLAGLFSLTENPAVAIRALGYVVDSGIEIAEDPFLRRYSPVKAYAMDYAIGLLIQGGRSLTWTDAEDYWKKLAARVSALGG